MDAKLNPKQKEALVAITAPYGLVLPPILIIGKLLLLLTTLLFTNKYTQVHISFIGKLFKNW